MYDEGGATMASDIYDIQQFKERKRKGGTKTNLFAINSINILFIAIDLTLTGIQAYYSLLPVFLSRVIVPVLKNYFTIKNITRQDSDSYYKII